MDYSNKLLGKSIEKLTYEDIENYFNSPKEETDLIEYKSYDSREKEKDQYKNIFKAICALLNSGGGIVVWGAPQGQEVQGKKEKQFFGQLCPIEFVIEKDAFVNKIADSIIPIPSGVKVEVRENAEARIVVIEIQKSDYSPHQTNSTYFMRLDGQSRPAPHHYVEALFKQIKYPNLRGFIKISDGKRTNNILAPNPRLTTYTIPFEFSIWNFSLLQNEEQLRITITAEKGKIIGNADQIPGSKLNFQYSLLHSAIPISESLTLQYERTGMGTINLEDRLIILFGGKNSPVKKTDCKFSVKTSNNYPAFVSIEVIDIVENQMLNSEDDKLTMEQKVEYWKRSTQ